VPNSLLPDLDKLPKPSANRMAVRVTKDAQRHIRSGHPWVFDGSIESVSHEGQPGDLAVVFDQDRRFVAIGLYDPSSPIRLRMLHHGKPVTIDAEWLASRIGEAMSIRQPLVDDDDTTAYRLVNGENDGLPGLVIDYYAGVAVVKLYSLVWVPWLKAVVDAVGADTVVLRLSRNIAHQAAFGKADGPVAFGLVDGVALRGEVPTGSIDFVENGLHFEADVVHGQKTGHFLDQRDNRRRVRDLSMGTTVLDVFSCTGGFSLHAAAGGAESVHSVDLSGHALEALARNVERNQDNPGVANCQFTSDEGDAFKVMEELGRRGRKFDVVIVDPPSFAQRQHEVDRALRAYQRLTHLAMPLLKRGGLLVQASCSSRVDTEQFLFGVQSAAGYAGRQTEVIATTGHGLDHPIGFTEGAYLDCVFATVN